MVHIIYVHVVSVSIQIANDSYCVPLIQVQVRGNQREIAPAVIVVSGGQVHGAFCCPSVSSKSQVNKSFTVCRVGTSNSIQTGPYKHPSCPIRITNIQDRVNVDVPLNRESSSQRIPKLLTHIGVATVTGSEPRLLASISANITLIQKQQSWHIISTLIPVLASAISNQSRRVTAIFKVRINNHLRQTKKDKVRRDTLVTIHQNRLSATRTCQVTSPLNKSSSTISNRFQRNRCTRRKRRVTRSQNHTARTLNVNVESVSRLRRRNNIIDIERSCPIKPLSKTDSVNKRLLIPRRHCCLIHIIHVNIVSVSVQIANNSNRVPLIQIQARSNSCECAPAVIIISGNQIHGAL